MSPSFSLQGTVGHGRIVLPAHIMPSAESYPIHIQQLAFSYQNETPKRPLHITLKQVSSEASATLSQPTDAIENLSIKLDLSQPGDSLTLMAHQLHWNPAPLIGTSSEPDTSNWPRLGQLSASLFQLPVQAIHVTDLVLTGWLSHASLHFSKAPEQTQFELKGNLSLVSEDPLSFDARLKTSDAQSASFHLMAADQHQLPLLTCTADWQFTSEVPEEITCNSDNVTKLSTRLGLKPKAWPRLASQVVRIRATRLGTDSQNQPSASNPLQHWQYRIQTQFPKHAQVSITLPDWLKSESDTAALDLTQDGHWLWDFSLSPHRAQFSLQRPEAVQVSLTAPQTRGQVTLQQLQCQFPLHPETAESETPTGCQAAAAMTFNAETLATTTLQARQIDLSQQFSIRLDPAQLQVRLSETRLSAAVLQFPDMGGQTQQALRQIELKAPQFSLESERNASKPFTQWHISSHQTPAVLFEADYSGIRPVTEQNSPQRHPQPVQKISAETSLRLNTVTGDFSEGDWHLTSDYQHSLHLTLNEQRFPALHQQGHINARPHLIGLTGLVRTAQSPPWLEYAVSTQPSTASTRIQIQPRRLDFSGDHSLKKMYLAQLPFNIDLNNGSLTLAADLKYDKAHWSGAFDVFTEHLNGNIRDIHFADVNLAFSGQLQQNTLRSRTPMSIHAGWLFFGTLFQDITLSGEFDTQTPRYVLHRASAKALGGYLSTREVVTPSLRNIDRIPLRIQSLNLKKLIDLSKPKDIELTGLMDGVLPISIQDGFPVIKKGALFSRSPGGVLRYKEGSSIDENIESGSQNSLKVLARILKNYQYDSLAVDIDYSKDGQLNASSRFKGRNPDFQNGRPVHINLNLEDDIPALIKTLNTINASQFERMFLKQLGLEK
ncbi:YdbH domain-containing protein (plasmid) [Photobacterium sp. GJ3]|uniref:YdbH domain-containing protein n=1 Tax=Photobacterium sp. GJ3 TaxID=2829502 RepID=UPI001B8C4437|nr:YdbH domain-containing protein [Photobacterium sp. GJ3]QUJ70370.1 YdbH domain-containing protein [Photobacterium sp. GJ3]